MAGRVFARRAELRRAALEGEPVRRRGRPDEIAAAVVWLSSDAASFLTGVTLPADGGWVAR
jgi:NAD(P)-dependent dehydrogenase (short-subunit alcohol dehydrogenase family)